MKSEQTLLGYWFVWGKFAFLHLSCKPGLDCKWYEALTIGIEIHKWNGDSLDQRAGLDDHSLKLLGKYLGATIELIWEVHEQNYDLEIMTNVIFFFF